MAPVTRCPGLFQARPHVEMPKIANERGSSVFINAWEGSVFSCEFRGAYGSGASPWEVVVPPPRIARESHHLNTLYSEDWATVSSWSTRPPLLTDGYVLLENPRVYWHHGLFSFTWTFASKFFTPFTPSAR